VKIFLFCVLCGLLLVPGCSDESDELLIEAVLVTENSWTQKVPADQRSHVKFSRFSQRAHERMAKQLAEVLNRHPNAARKDKETVRQWIETFKRLEKLWSRAEKMSKDEFEKSDLPNRISTETNRFLAISHRIPDSVWKEAGKR